MHQVTGTIRKAPYTKTGSNAKGEWKMFAVDLSESWKDKDGNRQYTNYRAVMFASSPGAISYNDEVLVEGSVVSIACESLQVVNREHDGKTYTHLEMIQPRVVFAKAPDAAPQQQQRQQATQPRQQQAPVSSGNDFDNDIPFAPMGLQYATHAIYSI